MDASAAKAATNTQDFLGAVGVRVLGLGRDLGTGGAGLRGRGVYELPVGT